MINTLEEFPPQFYIQTDLGKFLNFSENTTEITTTTQPYLFTKPVDDRQLGELLYSLFKFSNKIVDLRVEVIPVTLEDKIILDQEMIQLYTLQRLNDYYYLKVSNLAGSIFDWTSDFTEALKIPKNEVEKVKSAYYQIYEQSTIIKEISS